MPRDPRHPRRGPRRLARWLATLLTLALLVAAAATAYQLGWVDEWLDPTPAAAPPEPPAPWEASVPSPAAVAPAAEGRKPDPAKVAAALAGPLGDDDLGRHVAVEIAPLAGGDPVLTKGRDAAVPASVTKLLTSLAALEVLGPETTFTTKVVQPAPGRIVLVGGGDPLLGSRPSPRRDPDYPPRADLRTLAADTAAALTQAGVAAVRLDVDDSLFAAPTTSPHWPASYVPDDVVSRITALWADQGNDAAGRRVADPSLAAAALFADDLRARGIAVRPTIGRATGDGTTVATAESAPLREIVQHTLETSDNDAAEVIAHHVGAKLSGAGTFDGGVAATLATLTRLGVPTTGLQLYDGSGLSRDDRIAPATLTGVLRVAAQKPELAAVLTGLPVAGFTGSLIERFEDAPSAPGLGLARLKTGTLTGVNTYAGTVTDLDGDVMTFVVMADQVEPAKTLGARQALDDAAAALAGCHCSAG
ncbi:D-alanyl-D-alanine carboxypeptidase / D-alanyl-D-alanine-endopeptidase (penicillin-binding protein 4) [Nocardioides terrae]|uniref:D-alanyl-D-alanine carboxypeptidase / D-alanyl-D-alanine-endopeptidase (Penicillin-binding protein 4) n=1 Tax=Nocardioides terrae TaxID=574651 RepID=A0A1I1H7B4_9ACTN|nr:D-alanyl-D-alanine carboxypeptidase/D-alanyl-D-alanine-endopeptidase [Nocardioides terrae]SFC19897.1 D-alanyl-D-alanine carboxypeptidase / D-alanyl-D-alanine-endopeptidase (penicillin-binding protein 4) [Nocardioides terrae]